MVVTGGSDGIGLATAKAFAAEGAKVYVTARRKDRLDAAVTVIGDAAVGVQGDVGNLGDLERLYEQIKREQGRVDVVFANAGISESVAIDAIDEAHFDRMFGANVKGMVFTVQKALPLLASGGAVILAGSGSGSKHRWSDGLQRHEGSDPVTRPNVDDGAQEPRHPRECRVAKSSRAPDLRPRLADTTRHRRRATPASSCCCSPGRTRRTSSMSSPRSSAISSTKPRCVDVCGSSRRRGSPRTLRSTAAHDLPKDQHEQAHRTSASCTTRTAACSAPATITRTNSTRAEAREAIFDFVEVFYKRRRRHSTLGYLGPVDFEIKFVEEKMGARQDWDVSFKTGVTGEALRTTDSSESWKSEARDSLLQIEVQFCHRDDGYG